MVDDGMFIRIPMAVLSFALDTGSPHWETPQL
jgi:hypothetical protein